MSGDEPFLARWSRRKRDVAARAAAEKNPPPRVPEVARPAPPEAREALPATSLPPIESIEPASDIQPFLAPGVPLELTRAALRRAWLADPAIRDFIGLSENAWDFNRPDGAPGFASLDQPAARRLVAQVLGEPQLADPAAATAIADRSATSAEAATAAPAAPISEPPESIASTRHENGEGKPREPPFRRRHGGALPQ